MIKCSLIVFIFFCGYGYAQSSGIGTAAPLPAAAFEVKSASGGFLGPRLSTMQRDAIMMPALGLMIYNTDSNCYEFWNGTQWFNTCVDGTFDASSNGTASVRAYDCGGSTQGVVSSTIGFMATKQINVTVARKGSYSIGTDKVNGIYFRDSGFFENIGNNLVTLTAYGSPIATGTFSYALNTVPSCSFQAAAENESLLVIASQPEAPAASCSGVGTISLSVSVSGTTGITYAWRRNGLVLSDDAVISGSQTAALQLSNPRSSDSGIYDAVISGDGTSPISSAAVEVAVNPSPRLVAADQTICLPGTANLTLPGVTLGSTAGLAYSYFTDALATVPYGSATVAGVGTYYKRHEHSGLF